VAWSYYGDRSAEFILGAKAVPVYRVVYCLLIPVGAVVKLSFVWNLADVMNALMALPNLVGVLLLSGVVAKLGKGYFGRKNGP
jgi:AGCS family alanine or glycine:cation symporter